MKVEKRVQTRLLMGLRGRLARDSLTQILDLSAGLRQLKPSLDEAGEDHDGLSSALVACDSAAVST